MEKKEKLQVFGLDFGNITDTLLKLFLLYLLLSWCGDIIKPFLLILIWGGIIAIATYPLFLTFQKIFKKRSVLSSISVTLIMLSVFIIPSWLIIDSLFEGIVYLKTMYHSQGLIIPPPDSTTQNWPAITKPIIDLWREVSVNTSQAIQNHSEQLKSVALWIFGAFSGFSQGLLQFIASIIIAGVYFVYAESIYLSSIRVFSKLAGDKGQHLIEVTLSTIRKVVKGIIGVAVIQAALAGAGLFFGGIPYAGLWTILSLIFAIVQIGAGPIVIPAIIYSFSVDSTLHASIFTAWMILVLISDNVLKPILLGRGAPAPMLVIFLGAIGGFISHGFIGLFLGAVMLTLAYKLFETWVEPTEYNEDKSDPKETSTTENT